MGAVQRRLGSRAPWTSSHKPLRLPCALAGILFALLQLPEAVAAIPGAQADAEAALHYVLTLECDAEGRPGKRGRDAWVATGRAVGLA